MTTKQELPAREEDLESKEALQKTQRRSLPQRNQTDKKKERNQRKFV